MPTPAVPYRYGIKIVSSHSSLIEPSGVARGRPAWLRIPAGVRKWRGTGFDRAGPSTGSGAGSEDRGTGLQKPSPAPRPAAAARPARKRERQGPGPASSPQSPQAAFGVGGIALIDVEPPIRQEPVQPLELVGNVQNIEDRAVGIDPVPGQIERRHR